MQYMQYTSFHTSKQAASRTSVPNCTEIGHADVVAGELPPELH